MLHKSDWEKIESVSGPSGMENIVSSCLVPEGDDVPPPTCSLAGIKPVAQRWLWPGRIPIGYLTALFAPRGTGKSMIALDIAARVTNGTPWPDAPERKQSAGSVLLITAEDHLESIVVPRLIAAGADLAKIHGLAPSVDSSGEPRPFQFHDLTKLEQAMRAIPDLRLVVIDPYVAVLGTTNDRRSNTHAKKLAEVAKIAAEVGAAVLLVNATDKGSNGKTWQYACDALPALETLARAVWIVAEDPEDHERRMFLPARVNLAADPGGLGYTIDRETGRVVWGTEPIALRAADVVKLTGRAASEVVKATAWLREFLKEAARRADEVLREGSLAGFSRRALYAAKERLGVDSCKDRDRFAGCWWWRLPAPADTARSREDSKITPARAECSEPTGEHPEDSKIAPSRVEAEGRRGAEDPDGSKRPGVVPVVELPPSGEEYEDFAHQGAASAPVGVVLMT